MLSHVSLLLRIDFLNWLYIDDSHPYINEPAYSAASSTSSTSAMNAESKDPDFSPIPLPGSAAEGEKGIILHTMCSNQSATMALPPIALVC